MKISQSSDFYKVFYKKRAWYKWTAKIGVDRYQSPVFQKERLKVARFQTVLCHNFNVDIKTHIVASALNQISDTFLWLKTIDWYDIKARLMAHRIAFPDFRNISLNASIW